MEKFGVLASSLFAWLLASPQAGACVGCRTEGETLGDPQQIVQAGLAFSWSVLFMLAVVFTLIFGLVWFLVNTCRAADARHAVVQNTSDSSAGK